MHRHPVTQTHSFATNLPCHITFTQHPSTQWSSGAQGAEGHKCKIPQFPKSRLPIHCYMKNSRTCKLFYKLFTRFREMSPRELRELLSWPDRFLQGLRGMMAAEGGLTLFERVAARFAEGICIRTAFSGIDCFRMAVDLTERQMVRDGCSSKVRCDESCDIDPLCRRILRAWPNHADHMLLDDVFSAVTKKTRERLDDIARNFRRKYDVRLASGEAGSQVRAALSQQVFARMADVLKDPGAYVDLKKYRTTAMLGSLIMAIGGSPCIDWSTVGTRSGLLGLFNAVFMVWLFERVHRQEDIIVHENTEKFEEAWLVQAMGPTHHVVAFLISPHNLGFPAVRNRKWTLMASKKRFAGWEDFLENDRSWVAENIRIKFAIS